MASTITVHVSDATRIDRERDARVRAVVTEHHEFVWRSLRRLGLREDAADDAAQEVFCVFARRAHDVPPAKEKTFLFGVVIRVAQAARRKCGRDAATFEREDEGAFAQVPTSEQGPDEQLDEARARARLDAILATLPLDLRTVFLLYELEEMTMAEIAAVLSLPPGTVASRLRRARAEFERLAHAAIPAAEGTVR